nr:hypothetical protein CFP56_31563 [Quercus suber]
MMVVVMMELRDRRHDRRMRRKTASESTGRGGFGVTDGHLRRLGKRKARARVCAVSGRGSGSSPAEVRVGAVLFLKSRGMKKGASNVYSSEEERMLSTG